ncbi:MAG: T9SS type A sorting domain-containing protein [Chitinophagales bacterium]|nr:T9SS type A sorting domain-containing protein [Chitinophagales bacterium]
MRKTIFYTFLLLCFMQAANAQTPNLLQPAAKRSITHPGIENAKTQTLKYRITGGHSDYYDGGIWTPSDSVSLTYTGTRGEGLPLIGYISMSTSVNLEYDQQLYYIFDGTIWVKSFKYDQEFDLNDNITNSTYSNWDGAVYVPSYRYLYTYNPDQTLATEEEEDYTGGIWENDDITQYFYDAGKLNYTIQKLWDGVAYEDDSKVIYIYDITNGLPTSITYQGWTGVDWENNFRFVVSYNENNQIVQELSQNWDGVDWIDSYSYTYEYDTDGLLYVSTYYSSIGDPYNRSVYTYDENYHLDEILYQVYDAVEGFLNSSKTSLDFIGEAPYYIYSEIWDGSTFIPSSRVYYYAETFDDGEVAIEDRPSHSLSCTIYPQPASGKVIFDIQGIQAENIDLTIFDMHGKLIVHKNVVPVNGSITLSENDLPQTGGLFTWKLITAKGESISGKMMLE